MDSRNQIRWLSRPAPDDGDDRRAYTRNGYNWVSKFSRIAGAFDIEGKAIVDGEVVVIHEGRTNFSELQADLGRGDQDRLLYFAFDLLWLGGRDLRREPQIERKRLLKDLIEEHDSRSPSSIASTTKGTVRRCSSQPAS
ncbi:hypothetical protein [Bradyrhizobium sp. CW7]|uniref:ATP-dependent DNA ligase n=1 Tax=Bradyrhizobium sp. CW7 TaxID=2782688 RepID=UPI00320968E0